MEKSIIRIIHIEGRNIYENIILTFVYGVNDKLYERPGDFRIIFG